MYALSWVSSSLGILYVHVERTDGYESSAPTVAAAGVEVAAVAHGHYLRERALWYAPAIVVDEMEREQGLVTVLLYDATRSAIRYRIRSARAESISAPVPLALYASHLTGECDAAPGGWGRFWRTTGYAGHVHPEPDWMGVARHGFGCSAGSTQGVQRLGDRFDIVLELSVERTDGVRDEVVRIEMVRRRSSRARVLTLLDTLASLG